MAKTGGIKNIFEGFAVSTSMHGLGTLVSAKSLKGRIFWSTVCVGSMGMFLYMLSRIVQKYLQFPVNVKISRR